MNTDLNDRIMLTLSLLSFILEELTVASVWFLLNHESPTAHGA